MFTSAQSRAARGLLDWSQTDLATKAGISLSTVRDFETGKRSPIANNLAAMRKALEAAGIEFIPENGGGAGVRLRKRTGPPDEGLRPEQLTSENAD
jgi:transcriptional regulator with XRE-family HTH domain